MKGRRAPKRVVVIDDSKAFADLWSMLIRKKYGDIAEVETYGHPFDCLPKLDNTVDLLIADLEMPGMDGEKFLDSAREKGVPAGRIIVTSTLPAEELHQRFQLGEAIAVMNKTEARQQEAFLMILDAVMKHQRK